MLSRPATWMSIPVDTSDWGRGRRRECERHARRRPKPAPVSRSSCRPAFERADGEYVHKSPRYRPLGCEHIQPRQLDVRCAMFSKILVANRGEIAIRAFRAAYEVGARTVAVYPYEDRASLHRLKADEAYQIGGARSPRTPYLDVDEIIRVARECGADAIYPGYGFLSENPELAEKAAANGITFIGPPAEVLSMAGNKVTAKEHAIAAGVPVLRSTPASDDIDALLAQAEEIGFPLFAKAVAGGGGTRHAPRGGHGRARAGSGRGDARGAERVRRPADVPRAGRAASTSTSRCRSIADATGETVHLFERDCSVQRRHQKVIEIAPAPNLDDAVRRTSTATPSPSPGRSIPERGHRRVPARDRGTRRRRGRLHRDEPPHPGRAHRDRGGHRRRTSCMSQMRIAAGQTLAELHLQQDDIQ